jgi:hypothetical protein
MVASGTIEFRMLGSKCINILAELFMAHITTLGKITACRDE